MTTVATAPAPAKDGAIPMTEEQLFVFDLKGWLLLPGVLSEAELEPMREHVRTLVGNKKSLPENLRYSLVGPTGPLLDHPAIVGILRKILGAPDVGPDYYGFRCENSFPLVRKAGEEGLAPHGGSGVSVGPVFYQGKVGRIYSGLTRVVWELNGVATGAGGTLIMSGTHKMNFPIPRAHMNFSSPLFETYSCPPGSAMIFTEGLCHAGPRWNDASRDRLAVFNCYNHLMCQYHRLDIPPEVIDAMPAKRRSLFRGVWGDRFLEHPPTPNNFYDENNRAL